MEINEKRITEIFFAIILVTLLIILIFLFTSPSITGKSTSTTSNSYNTNSYNTYISYDKYPTTKTYYKKPYIKKDYHYLKYSDRVKHKKSDGMFGNEINRYIVYVKNRGHKGGYFTVKFYFSDYYGKTKTESIRHYIKPKEERKFFYQSIYSDEYEYYDWDYKVISETKTPYK